jgi:hypothetical protein
VRKLIMGIVDFRERMLPQYERRFEAPWRSNLWRGSTGHDPVGAVEKIQTHRAKAKRPAWLSAARPSRKRRRNRRESTRTDRKKPGLQAIQREPYQRVVDDLDRLIQAVGLKAA